MLRSALLVRSSRLLQPRALRWDATITSDSSFLKSSSLPGAFPQTAASGGAQPCLLTLAASGAAIAAMLVTVGTSVDSLHERGRRHRTFCWGHLRSQFVGCADFNTESSSSRMPVVAVLATLGMGLLGAGAAIFYRQSAVPADPDGCLRLALAGLCSRLARAAPESDSSGFYSEGPWEKAKWGAKEKAVPLPVAAGPAQLNAAPQLPVAGGPAQLPVAGGPVQVNDSVTALLEDPSAKAAMKAAGLTLAACGRPEVAALAALAAAMSPREHSSPAPHFNEVVVVLFASLDGRGGAQLNEEEWCGFYTAAQALSLFSFSPPQGCTNVAGWHEKNSRHLYADVAGPAGIDLSEFGVWCRRHMDKGQLFRWYKKM